MEANGRTRWVRLLTGITSLVTVVLLVWTVACGQNSPTDPSVSPDGDFVAGVTSSSALTTVLPPSPPPKGPVNHGILLTQDIPCPTCTLTTPRGSALVWFNTEIFQEVPEGEIRITMDQLNEALQPGQPLEIRVDNLDATQPVAQTLTVERLFTTVGSIDRSSTDVLATGEFMLAVVSEATGRVDIPYVLADGAVVEAFEVGERVYLSGIVNNGMLRVRLVRPDV